MSDSDMFDPIKTDEHKQTSALSFHHQMFSIILYKIAHFKTQVFFVVVVNSVSWNGTGDRFHILKTK